MVIHITRTYSGMLKTHLATCNQMVFVEGARQVGKTTLAKSLNGEIYLNWDDDDTRKLILSGVDKVAQHIGLDELAANKKIVIFDELHKFSRWKTFLKAFYDLYNLKVHIIITGSSKLGIYKKGGDSMMGRYFPYRIHPLSTAEIIGNLPELEQEIQLPKKISNDQFETLLKFGGFPDPFLKNSITFWNKWKKVKNTQLLKEDIRELSQIHELSQMEVLASILINQAGGLTNKASLANKVRVSAPTITRWLDVFESFFFIYKIHPWSNNIPRSLIKEPKMYLWDWSLVTDKAARFENMVASHLLKFTHFWTDSGFGDYSLYFIRDKQQKEVDFLVTKDNQPWFLVEVKTSKKQTLNKNLAYFQKLLNCPHAFQVALDMDYLEIDCFKQQKPIIVPAKTFLSQLV